MKIRLSKDRCTGISRIAVLSGFWCVVISFPEGITHHLWKRWYHKLGLPGILVQFWPQHKTDGSIASTALIRYIEI